MKLPKLKIQENNQIKIFIFDFYKFLKNKYID